MKFKLEAPGGLIDIRARCENGRGMVKIQNFFFQQLKVFFKYYFYNKSIFLIIIFVICYIFIISKVIEVTMASMPSFVGWLAPLHHWLIEGGS